MLAVFDCDTARGPNGIELNADQATRHHRNWYTEEHLSQIQKECQEEIQQFIKDNPAERCLVDFGRGNGYGLQQGTYCCYSSQKGVHIAVCGEIFEWPGIDAFDAAHDAFVRGEPETKFNDAQLLHELYSTFQDDLASDLRQDALDSLEQIQGKYAFVIYDSINNRVLAARDPKGSQPFYWGNNQRGQLMFATEVESLSDSFPSATSFPSGTLYINSGDTMAMNPGVNGWIMEGEQRPGIVMSFVKDSRQHYKEVQAVPRVNSRGALCGAVFKVASYPDMAQGPQIKGF